MTHTKPQKKIIDQRNLKFIPTVVAIMAGETVDFPNNDKSWHNVYSKGGANDFDLGLYASGKTRSKKFDKPGVARILCNAHPNMETFVVVKDYRFFLRLIAGATTRLKTYPWARCVSRFDSQSRGQKRQHRACPRWRGLCAQRRSQEALVDEPAVGANDAREC